MDNGLFLHVCSRGDVTTRFSDIAEPTVFLWT